MQTLVFRHTTPRFHTQNVISDAFFVCFVVKKLYFCIVSIITIDQYNHMTNIVIHQ